MPPPEKKEHILMRFAYRVIPDELLDNHETHLKSVVLLFTLISILVFSILLIIALNYFFSNTPAIREGGMKLITICIAIYTLSLIILNRFAALHIAGNLTLAGIYFNAVISGWATGGIYSPLMYILFIPPVFAFIITNIKSSISWLVVTVITFISIWGVDELALRYEFFEPYESLQVMIAADDVTALTIIIPLTSLIAILTVVTIYELNSLQIKKLLSLEKNMFAFKASHDPLTGLDNRAEFDVQIKISSKQSWHSDSPLALVYIDLDGFKPVNDTLGHHAGDTVLIAISDRMKKNVRGTDVVARLGGDEFAIILQGVGDNQTIEPILKKLLTTISEDITLDDGKVVNVNGSLGVAYYPEDSEDPDRLCRYADMAMYLAKEEKNTWRYYQQVMEQV